MKKQIKKPWIAAILNFFLWGLGYVYTGKRIGFGVGLIIANLIYSGVFGALLIQENWGVIISFWIGAVVLSVLFAYDGYKTAEEFNKETDF